MSNTLTKDRTLFKKDKQAFKAYINNAIESTDLSQYDGKPVLMVFSDYSNNRMITSTCTENASTRFSSITKWWLEFLDNGNTPAHVNVHVQNDYGVLAYLKHSKFDMSNLRVKIIEDDGLHIFDDLDDVKAHQTYLHSIHPSVRDLMDELLEKLVSEI